MKNNLATAAVMIAALVYVAGASHAKAQQATDPKNQTVTFELDGADVRDALKLLFQQVNAQYTVTNDVQGLVIVHLHDVPFETALRNILNQADASYRVEGGIYEITKKQALEQGQPDLTTPPAQEAANFPIRIPLMHAAPEHILEMLRGVDNVSDSPEPIQGSYAMSGGGGQGGIGGGGQGGLGGQGGGGFGGGGIGGGGGTGGGGGGGAGGGIGGL